MSAAEAAYAFTMPFPPAEMYGLTSQIRRSAASIAANIAEGYGRDSSGAYVNHLRIAQGSLKEFETFVELACRVGLASVDAAQPLLDQCDELGRMSRALNRAIERT
jgi:four helix bundle protein